jgi:hypothetical protein
MIIISMVIKAVNLDDLTHETISFHFFSHLLTFIISMLLVCISLGNEYFFL